MWMKEYGKTGKQVSVIGFGGMRFQNPKDIAASAETVLYAHSKGVNYFDTAPGYCDDHSEDIVGTALRQLDRDAFVVSTKCSSPDGPTLRASLERSLQRLHVDAIDFFHIWCLIRDGELESRIKGGAVAALLKAKEEGLVKHVVFSSHLGGAELCHVIESGLFEGMTVGYNALNFPYRTQGLALAKERGMGVVTMNPLSGGLIPQHPDMFSFLKGPQDDSVVQAALRFNVSQPEITVALVGFANPHEVDEAVQAVKRFEPYTPEHVETVKQHVKASFNGFCTGCRYCMPCPQGVAIPMMMDAYNMKILQGKDDAVTNRLKWHWGVTPENARLCNQCGKCESLCTQHLDIRHRLSEIADLPSR